MAPGAFRFLLASVVVVFHYTSFGIGHAPVYLFFALSGYWVHVMWQHKYAATRDPYVTFVVSRAWRLAPVFLLCSLLALAIVDVLPRFMSPRVPVTPLDVRALVASFLIFGYNTAGGAPLVPAWSLDIEMEFYVVAPLIILLMQHRPRVALFACAVVSAVSFALFYDRAFTSYLPWFVAGMLAARYPVLRPSRSMALGSAALTLAVIGVFAAAPALRPVLFGGAHRSAAYLAWNPPFNIALAAIALPFAIGSLSLRSNTFDRLLSDASYSLYLVHWLPLLFISHYVSQIAGLPYATRALVTAPLILLAYATAFGLTLCVDRPCGHVREHFVALRRAKRATAPGYEIAAESPGH
ncbi:acyltransferase family protein [Paraburkholderia adhaesiva]|uniref:acyltransferase family protein n=1 Tax=Paraburkholderia adhaesiva TaxID=2883244 RepID=UPI001F2134CB|nr:acyltransferase [Paraburkholderia adhaesiva]